jgi:hypothetical protein
MRGHVRLRGTGRCTVDRRCTRRHSGRTRDGSPCGAGAADDVDELLQLARIANAKARLRMVISRPDPCDRGQAHNTAARCSGARSSARSWSASARSDPTAPPAKIPQPDPSAVVRGVPAVTEAFPGRRSAATQPQR